MRVLIMGTGSVGGYFGALMARNGEDVWFVARNKNLEALRNHGLQVRSQLGYSRTAVKAIATPKEAGFADLILFCVKTYYTMSAARSVLPVVGENSTVLTLQNGIDSVETIESIIGAGHTLAGVAYIESILESPGVVHQIGGARKIIFGEVDGHYTERCLRIKELLDRCGIVNELSAEIESQLWRKFLFICALAGMTALTRTSYGAVLNFLPTRKLFLNILEEGVQVAKAKGVRLPDDITDKIVEFTQNLNKEGKTSMQRDLEAKKRLEIDSLNGALVRLGRQLNVPTPINEVVWACLKVQENYSDSSQKSNE